MLHGYNTRHACSACMDSLENSLRNPLKNPLYVLWPQPSTHMTISAVVMYLYNVTYMVYR